MKKLDRKKTVDIINNIKYSGIGDSKIWESLIRKINAGEDISKNDKDYFVKFSSIYKEGKISSRTKIYHIKLGDDDSKPVCKMCDDISQYYCNMNDQYYCPVHILGHDDNEL